MGRKRGKIRGYFFSFLSASSSPAFIAVLKFRRRIGRTNCQMFTASAWRAPRHAASSGSDKEQLCQLRGIGPVKQNFKAKLCSRIRFFAHLSLIAAARLRSFPTT